MIHVVSCSLAVLGLLSPDGDVPPVLRAGDSLDGAIEATDPVIHTDFIDGYDGSKAHGKSYGVERSVPGPIYIELRSHLFDAYLVLRGPDGQPLFEDGNGLLNTHSRIVVSANVEGPFLVDAVAFYGGVGAFHLSVHSGEPRPLSSTERREREIADARETVAVRENALGPDHPDTAKSLNSLAWLLMAERAVDEARPLLERALRIREAALGPDHLSTASSLNNLASALQDQGAFDEARPLYERALRIREAALGPDHTGTARIVNNLASLFQDQGTYDEARPLYERALRINEAAHGPAHLSTAASVNNLASLLHDQGAFDEARALFERALRIREDSLGPDHPDTADSLNRLASLFEAQGAYEDARPLAERALQIQESAFGPDHPDTAKGLSNLASLLLAQGAIDEARPLLERALRIREAALGPDHLSTASSMNNLAISLEDQGAFDEARPLFERALKIKEAAYGPDHLRTATALNNLAGNLQAQGEIDDARPLYERALRIRETVLGPNHPSTATSLSNLAVLLRAQGSVDEARPLHERALRIREAALGPDHPVTGQSLNNLALLLQAQGGVAEARPLLERALRIDEAAFGPDHPSTALGLNNLAVLLNDQGAYGEARPLYERALRVRELALGPDHPDTAQSLNNLAMLLRDQGEFAEARPLFERALKIREAAFGPDHPNTALNLNNLAMLLEDQGAVDEARALHERSLRIREEALGPDHPSTARSLNNLAALEFDLGETERALTRSKTAVRVSAAHLERVMWSLSETERLRFVREKEAQLALLLSLTGRGAAEAPRRVGYEAVLNWKGQVARSLLRDGRRAIRSLPQAERAIVERLRALQAKLSDAVYTKKVTDPAALAERLKELRTQRNELEIELARRRGRGEGNEERDEGTEEVARLAALTTALPEHAAAVDFFVHRWYEPAVLDGDELVRRGAWTEQSLSAWVTRPDEPLAQLDLGPASVVEEAVRVFLEEMVRRRGSMVAPAGSDSSLTTENNDRLRELLWEPLAGAIGDARTVFLSGDSFLGTLPFETVQLEDGSYLIEHHAFTYLADMQSLGEALAPVERREPALFAAGGIDYRRRGGLDADDAAEEDGDADGLIAMSDTRAALSRRWSPLDGTGGEVSAIADMHLEATDDEGTQRVLKEREATEERIKESISEFSHVHVATHGYFHPEGLPSAWKKIRAQDDAGRELLRETEQQVVGLLPGLLSGLVFAGANAKPEAGRDNGLLTAEEITYLDLSNCDLVVLSACETGLGRAEGGEGMIGLRRAFRMAGARTVISSLWEVSDSATRELMTLFYENLWLEEESKLEALRNAQLMQLEYNRERHGHGLPSTWGAFVLDGAPD